jgi:alanine-synthesizing transaminase
MIDGVAQSRVLESGRAARRDVRVHRRRQPKLPSFDDETFAMELLEQQHVLIAPGSSFNTPIATTSGSRRAGRSRLAEVFQRMEHVLEQLADRPPQLETA